MSNFCKNVVSLLLCVLFCNITYSKNEVCIKSTPCLCKFNDNKFIDISHVTKDNQFLIVSNEKLRYYFNPCEIVKFNASQFNINATTNDCQNGTSLCAYNKTSNGTLTNLGTAANVIFSNDYPVSLIYNVSTKISSLITLECTPDGSESYLHSVSSDNSSHQLILFSPFACVKHSAEGLSTGSTLLILLSTGFGVYLLGGILVLRLFRGARGSEMIPNLDFWLGLPSLVRDGFVFLLNGCSPLSVSTAETYDRI